MPVSTSSAEPQKLFRYSDTGTRIDRDLDAESRRLAGKLQQFEAVCTEERMPVSHLAPALTGYAAQTELVDAWVRRVGVSFKAADAVSWLAPIIGGELPFMVIGPGRPPSSGRSESAPSPELIPGEGEPPMMRGPFGKPPPGEDVESVCPFPPPAVVYRPPGSPWPSWARYPCPAVSPDLPTQAGLERLLKTVFALWPVLLELFLKKLKIPKTGGKLDAGILKDILDSLLVQKSIDEIDRARDAWLEVRLKYGKDSPQAREAEDKWSRSIIEHLPIVGPFIQSLLDMAKANPVISE
jgi:hypothetical protein